MLSSPLWYFYFRSYITRVCICSLLGIGSPFDCSIPLYSLDATPISPVAYEIRDYLSGITTV